MPALRTILAKFGFDIDDKKLDSAKAKTDEFATTVVKLANRMTGGDFLKAGREWLDQIQEQGDALAKSATNLGINTQALQQWRTAADMAGVSGAEIENIMKILQKNAAGATSAIGDAASAIDAVDGTSSKNAGEAFKLLGIQVKDAAGQIKPVEVLMKETGLAIAKIQDPARRTQLSLQVFGKAGSKLGSLFKDGEEGLKSALSALEDFGGGLSDEILPLAESWGDRQSELNLATLSLKNTLALAFFPALIRGTKALAGLVAWFSKTAKGTEIVKSALFILGAAFLYTQRQAIAAGIKTAIAWAPTILLFTALALILDDVWTAFKGGDSVIGKVLDKLLGVGNSKAIFGQMGKDVDALGGKLGKIPSTGDKIEEVFSTVGASLVKFFVDDIPEAFGFMTKGLGTSIAKWFTDLNDSFTYGLLDIIHSIVNWTKKAATAITDGIANGLTEGWEKVKKTFTELFESLEKDFKKFFRINSPSARIHDLTEFLPMGAVNALAEWEPKVREQSEETFASIAPGSPTFAPVIRVPTVSSAGGPTGPLSKRVDMHNEFKIVVQGGGTGVRDAARDGVGLAFDDERRAMLAALEDGI